MLQDELYALASEAVEAIQVAKTNAELGDIRQKYLGKNGSVTTSLKGIGKAAAEERKTLGQVGNQVKKQIQAALENREKEILETSSFVDHVVDVTVPGITPNQSTLHPITQMTYDLNDAFLSLGFEVFSGPEITSEQYEFDNLNFPADHPARESMDTYWLKPGAIDKEIPAGEEMHPNNRLALRPHLTGSSVRYLQKYGAPARFVYPGRVYRNETTDSGHERAFFQYEALIVDKDFSFASGQLLIRTILAKVFGRDIPVRMRSGYFPFVEPGFEIDMQCQVCLGNGCSLCGQTGWVEVMPGGIPHPNVFKAAGLDPEEWSGFYINIGLDRLVMMRYGIDDVRLFHSTDLRFLEQYK